MTDKIVRITTSQYTLYGISESGRLWRLDENESQWIFLCESPDLELPENAS